MKTNKKLKEPEFRRVTADEHSRLKKMAMNTLKKMGRPFKPVGEKAVSIHLKVHPQVLESIKNKAKKSGLPYQTLINQILKKAS